jgi:hypothetical protein
LEPSVPDANCTGCRKMKKISLDDIVEEYERNEQIVEDLNYYFNNQPINPWENDYEDEN